MCAKVGSVPVAGGKLSNMLGSGQVPAAWGGVIDLIENAQTPDTSARYRCTMHMDLIPDPAGQAPNPDRIAFWTAEHCLRWLNANYVELNVFDPLMKKYVRFEVKLDEVERFKQGKELFRRLKPDGLEQFVNAAQRPATGIVERSAPVCKSDTATLLTQYPGSEIICSSVLDLARLEGTLSDASKARPEVVETVSRMRAELVKNEESEIAKAKTLEPLIGSTALHNMLWWYDNWRKQVGLVTKWRGYEGLTDIIESVRLCAAGDFSGICNQEFRDYFADSLNEYNRLATAGQTYREFLQFEVNRPETSTSHNLQWLLNSQKNVQNSLGLLGLVSMGSNFLRRVADHKAENVGTTLGTTGPLFYGALGLKDFETADAALISQRMHFFDKTILFRYSAGDENRVYYLNQPGDSGTVFLTGIVPIGIVSTVNGKETSGGASVTPLPDFVEEVEDKNTNSAQKKAPTLDCK